MSSINKQNLNKLGYMLVGTNKSIKKGLAEIGLNPTAYDLQEIEEKLNKDIQICQKCGGWTLCEALDEEGFCETCKYSEYDE